MSRTFLATLALATLLLPLGRAAAQTAAELRRETEAFARTGGHIPWSASTQLAWRNFRGRPRPAYFTVAQTSAAVTYQIGCLRQETRFTVLATFSTTESWVRVDIPNDTVAGPQILRHEQTHFDLAEVNARQLRQALASTSGLCPSNLQRARQLFDSLSVVSRELNARYDAETAHGTSPSAQAAWSADVTAMLNALARFSDP